MAGKFKSASELKRVRGLGSARSGVQSWWIQRITAVANLALLVWLLVSLLLLPTYDHGTITIWISQPLVAILLLLLIVSTFWHARLGIQVFIEDYVHDNGLKILALGALTFFLLFMGAVAAFSVLSIVFGAA